MSFGIRIESVEGMHVVTFNAHYMVRQPLSTNKIVGETVP